MPRLAALRWLLAAVLCSLLAAWTPKTQAASSAELLVADYYRNILGREPDSPGVAYWLSEFGEMQARAADPVETWRAMALAFFNSREYLASGANDAAFVSKLYNTFVARDPDAAGADFWRGVLGTGMPRDAVILAFLFSPEFDARMRSMFGVSASRAEVDMVVDFYRGILNRLPDDAGFGFWRSRFREAQCQGPSSVSSAAEAISSQFIGSAEYLARARGHAEYLSDLYNAFLRRGAEVEGFRFWLGELESGRRSREDVRRAFVASVEFAGRVRAVASARCLTLAEQVSPRITLLGDSSSPFIAMLEISEANPGKVSTVSFTVAPRPGTVSRAVNVDYGMAHLAASGHGVVREGVLRVPVFGLYSGYSNSVSLRLGYVDGSTATVPVSIGTENWQAPQAAIYANVNVLKARAPGSALGFDYFYYRTNATEPLVMDTDGHVRWWAPAPFRGGSTHYEDGEFFIGHGASMRLARLGLDGRVRETTVPGDYWRFHHNLEPGKAGMLAQVDRRVGDLIDWENVILEIAPDGAVLKSWSLADIIAAHMREGGDDPGAFVRLGVDWFHSNAVTYDPRDDSIIISSRENFVIKIDYATGAIRWIFGDPTKYWFTFPSLRARSVTLLGAGIYPLGQHAVSITVDGLLLLLNNGEWSFNQPAGAPLGVELGYTAVSGYAIDDAARTARQVIDFDYGKSLYSPICSSVYEAGESLLVSYSIPNGGATARLVGLDEALRVAFDFALPNGGCASSYNARPIAFESLDLR